MNTFANTLRKLLEETTLYSDLLVPSKGEIRACIELLDTGDVATLILSDKASVVKGSVHPDFKISMSNQTFREIIHGKADAFALAGRTRSDEVRPIEFEVYNKDRSKEVWETIKALLTYLFTSGKVKVKKLHPEFAGQAHGAHPIPLVYWNGLRCSWFLVKSGETLNKEGEKDPWPQMFISSKEKVKQL
ncbi:MAG: hypothetical protein QHH17_03910 [Candidatus Bathyarchaeota archaeon]|jgi:hypothetical protein|nr:hypothetical protein [Candidatus Bathyarchaeota archaeon]